jgi:hypothetical protein
MATSYFCWIVRLLPVMTSIYNVVIDGIIDTKSEPESPRAGTLFLGDGGVYGENCPDSMRNITVSNVIGVGKIAVTVGGFLTDSVITNVVNKNPGRPAIHVARENGLNNVAISNTVDAKRRF